MNQWYRLKIACELFLLAIIMLVFCVLWHRVTKQVMEFGMMLGNSFYVFLRGLFTGGV